MEKSWNTRCHSVTNLSGDAKRRRTALYDVARPLLMTPIDFWRNCIPVFGAVAFCTTNIENFRSPLTLTSLTISSTYTSHKRSFRWTSSKRKVMEVIEVDQIEDTYNERLSWAMPHSGLKPKNENDPKVEYDLRKTPFNRRLPLTEDDPWQKTSFNGRQLLIEDYLQ